MDYPTGFTFSKEHTALRKLIREVAEEELRPRAQEVDRLGRVPESSLRLLGELGLLGLPFPRSYGGAGAGVVGLCIAMEEIYRVCPSTAVALGVHAGIGAMSIHLDGTEQQKHQYLTPMALGEKIAAFALTEPTAGSDAGALRTYARREGDQYCRNGSKIYISNGPGAGRARRHYRLYYRDELAGLPGGYRGAQDGHPRQPDLRAPLPGRARAG